MLFLFYFKHFVPRTARYPTSKFLHKTELPPRLKGQISTNLHFTNRLHRTPIKCSKH